MRLALASSMALSFSVTIKCASSCEPRPPDIIFIIRRPMTLPDSNASDTVEKKGENIGPPLWAAKCCGEQIPDTMKRSRYPELVCDPMSCFDQVSVPQCGDDFRNRISIRR